MSFEDADSPARLAACIKARREERGLTIEKAVEALGRDRAFELVLGSYWHALEEGRPVPEACLPQIASALDLEVDDLLDMATDNDTDRS